MLTMRVIYALNPAERQSAPQAPLHKHQEVPGTKAEDLLYKLRDQAYLTKKPQSLERHSDEVREPNFVALY